MDIKTQLISMRCEERNKVMVTKNVMNRQKMYKQMLTFIWCYDKIFSKFLKGYLRETFH